MLICVSEGRCTDFPDWVYVLLSADLMNACTLSRNVNELDLGHGHWDHEPTAVDLRWTGGVPQHQEAKKQKLNFDPAMIQKHTIEAILQDYEPPAWKQDIEHQVNELNQQILQGLQRCCPKPRKGPKKDHISDELWQQRQDKLRVKAQLKEVDRRKREELLVTIFSSWASRRGGRKAPDGGLFVHYTSYLMRVKLRLVAQYYSMTYRLRRGLKYAKQNKLKEIFEYMPEDAPAATILHELKPILGPTNLKKLKMRTLPYTSRTKMESTASSRMRPLKYGLTSSDRWKEESGSATIHRESTG